MSKRKQLFPPDYIPNKVLGIWMLNTDCWLLVYIGSQDFNIIQLWFITDKENEVGWIITGGRLTLSWNWQPIRLFLQIDSQFASFFEFTTNSPLSSNVLLSVWCSDYSHGYTRSGKNAYTYIKKVMNSWYDYKTFLYLKKNTVKYCQYFPQIMGFLLLGRESLEVYKDCRQFCLW